MRMFPLTAILAQHGTAREGFVIEGTALAASRLILKRTTNHSKISIPAHQSECDTILGGTCINYLCFAQGGYRDNPTHRSRRAYRHYHPSSLRSALPADPAFA